MSALLHLSSIKFKALCVALFIVLSSMMHAQYGSIDAILTKLEKRRGMNQYMEPINLSGKKFILIEDFADHTERSFLVIEGKQCTLVELFDDKSNNESVSNVYSGDVVQSRKNMVSMRADMLEGKKIAPPVTKTFYATMQDDVLYLLDITTKKRWIEESALTKKK